MHAVEQGFEEATALQSLVFAIKCLSDLKNVDFASTTFSQTRDVNRAKARNSKATWTCTAGDECQTIAKGNVRHMQIVGFALLKSGFKFYSTADYDIKDYLRCLKLPDNLKADVVTVECILLEIIGSN